jgi:glycosyltransferase involved in cell wall biosynthesis
MADSGSPGAAWNLARARLEKCDPEKSVNWTRKAMAASMALHLPQKPTNNPIEAYFAAYDAHRRYQPENSWQEAFEAIARQIAVKIKPGVVLDAGCAFGLLVERLRVHGIDAYGIDPDFQAIEQVPQSIRPYCWQGSLSDALPARYDLIVSLEALKRQAWSDAQAAIANLCQYTDDILFVVTPFDFKGISTRCPYPPEDWAEAFARQGFFHDLEFEAESILPWAARFRRTSPDSLAGIAPLRILRDYERQNWLNSRKIQDLRAENVEMREELRQREFEIDNLNGQTNELLALRKEAQVLTRQVNEMSTQIVEWHNHWAEMQNSRAWRLFQAFERLQPRLAPEGSRRLRFLNWTFEVTRKIARRYLYRQRSGDEALVLNFQLVQGGSEQKSEASAVAGPPAVPDAAELLKIALYSSDPWTAACVHLRLVGPAYHAGSGIQVIKGTQWERELSINFQDEAQVVLIQRDFPRYETDYKQVIDWARSTGKPVIYELDDLLTELPDEHPEKGYYAEIRPKMLEAMQSADAVIVSTLALAEYARGYNSNTWVLPNYLDERIWRLEPINRSGNRIPLVIGYMGGITKTHLPDLALVTPLLTRLLLRYGDRLRLRFWGVCPPELEGLANVEFVDEKFPNYLEFAGYFSRQDCDLFIAPLRDNLFNRCKSAIKFIEYSSLGIPGVYSRVAPYEQLIISGSNGFLASDELEWEAGLTKLIEDASFRQQMGKAAFHTVDANWRMSHHAHEWGTIYHAALAGKPPQ